MVTKATAFVVAYEQCSIIVRGTGCHSIHNLLDEPPSIAWEIWRML